MGGVITPLLLCKSALKNNYNKCNNWLLFYDFEAYKIRVKKIIFHKVVVAVNVHYLEVKVR